MRWLWCIFLALIFSCQLYVPELSRGTLLINEVMAKNSESSGIIAPNGKYEDWFELYNSGNDTILLSDYYVTDNLNNLIKANLPTITIVPGDFALLWCGGKANMGIDFVGFSLSTNEKSVETLYLINKQLMIIDSCNLSKNLKAIKKNRSVGRLPDGGASWSVQAYPSPLRSNNG